jgi:hypothetical protein
MDLVLATGAWISLMVLPTSGVIIKFFNLYSNVSTKRLS